MIEIIRVTQAHIDAANGWRDDPDRDDHGGEGNNHGCNCPVARALRTPEVPRPSVGMANAYRGRYVARLSDEVREFIIAWDSGQDVQPIEFEADWQPWSE